MWYTAAILWCKMVQNGTEFLEVRGGECKFLVLFMLLATEFSVLLLFLEEGLYKKE